jgi:trehalose 6-phosphate phosphatase
MTDVGSPHHVAPLPEPLIIALTEIARTPKLLVALDFDGTLSPEVDDPEQARALPDARAAVLRLLNAPHTRVALVSGRALDSLKRVSALPDSALLIGSHGIEIRLDDADDGFALSAHEQHNVGVLRDVLGRIADSIDEVWLEPKPAGFALHTRLATTRNSEVAERRARTEAAAAIADLTVREGKNVLEFSVRSTTKGEAIHHLREYTSATAVFFAGDDVTDEDGFAALGSQDVGLKVGDGATHARHRVGGPMQIARVISLLADLRHDDADTYQR